MRFLEGVKEYYSVIKGVSLDLKGLF